MQPCAHHVLTLFPCRYFVYRDGIYHDVSGQSFRDFMQGRLPGLPGERAGLQTLGAGQWALALGLGQRSAGAGSKLEGKEGGSC